MLLRLKNIWCVSVCLLMTMTVVAQSKYCLSFADYQADRWIALDTLYLKAHSNARQAWWGGNDFKLTTGNKELDDKIKNDVFAITYHDSIFVNCKNMSYDGQRFGKGYTLAFPYGNNGLCFIHRLIGKKHALKDGALAYNFGVLGAVAARQDDLENRVCYVIETAEGYDMGSLRLIDDDFMEILLADNDYLLRRYKRPSTKAERRLASNVLEILRLRGLVK